MNAFESTLIKKIGENLDRVVIVNSCAVTQEAERQCRQAIRKARREYPDYDDMYEQIVSDHNKIYIAIKERNENDAYYYASIHSNRRKDRLLSYC